MPLTVRKSAEPLLQDGKNSLAERIHQYVSKVVGNFSWLVGFWSLPTQGPGRSCCANNFSADLSSKELDEEWYDKPAGSSTCKFVDARSFSTRTSRSFSKSLDYVPNWSRALLKMGDVSVSLLNLKSIDPFILPEEEILLRLSCTNFHRGWLYGSVVAFFLAKLLENEPLQVVLYGEKWDAILSKLDQLRYRDPEVIFIPVNLNSHWVLIVTDLKRKKLLFLDPGSQDSRSKYEGLIHIYSYALREFFPCVFEVSSEPHAVQQDDMSCGVFVCYYVYQLVNGCGIDVNFDVFSFRKYIYDTIVGECLDNARYSPCSEFELDRCGICNQKH